MEQEQNDAEGNFLELIKTIRKAFPQPGVDRSHADAFLLAIQDALAQVDALKSDIPLLGAPRKIDYAEAEQAKIADASLPLEAVSELLVKTLEGLPVWGHPNTQINVVGPTSIPSILGTLLSSIYNPNLVTDESAQGVAEAEGAVIAMIADLVGYETDKADGLFTFGGTGTNLYGVKLGIEKAFPGAMKQGIDSEGFILASKQGHSCRFNIAGWLGLGERCVVDIPTHLENDIRIDLLEEEARRLLDKGHRIAAIIATMGTTDALGIDDLEAIAEMRDRLVEEYDLDYSPHIHADAVIGWAWSYFNDYDLEANPLGFRRRTVRALAGARRRISHLHLADSIGIDFHKTGFAPYISSLLLVKNRNDFQPLTRGNEKMPYLFQTGERHPGLFSLETTRGGSGVLAALANLRFFGKTGMQATLGYLVEMAELLREHIEGHTYTTVMNSNNFGTVTLFRVYPDDVDTFTIKHREQSDPAAREELLAHNEFNRRLFHRMHSLAMQGKGVHISMTDCYRESDYGEPIVALKSYIFSPFVDPSHIELLVENILSAREDILAAKPV